MLAKLEGACDVDMYRQGDLPHEELLSRLAGKQGLLSVVTDTIDRPVFEAGRDLKVVSTIAVGYNNIDVAAARERNVVVTNTPDVLTEAAADLTWSLILSMTRRIVEGDRLTRRGAWKGFALDFMLGTDLRGKQLGIIGFGRIGKAVAAKASGFGMRVAFSRMPRSSSMARVLSAVSIISRTALAIRLASRKKRTRPMPTSRTSELNMARPLRWCGNTVRPIYRIVNLWL